MTPLTATVTTIDLGYTWGRHPCATARLSCGHVTSVVLVPYQGRCLTCGVEQPLAEQGATTCACGSTAFVFLTRRHPHVEADRITAIGDVVPCPTCAADARDLAWLTALDPATVHHARALRGAYYFYRRDEASPTGVSLIGSVRQSPGVEAVLAARRVSPLSPTEGI